MMDKRLKYRLIFFFLGLLIMVLLALFFTRQSKKIAEEMEAKSATLTEVPVGNIEVVGPRGPVMLHTAMPTDSVRLLLGRPAGAELHTIAGTVQETWTYPSSSASAEITTLPAGATPPSTTLILGFEDGLLTSVSYH